MKPFVVDQILQNIEIMISIKNGYGCAICLVNDCRFSYPEQFVKSAGSLSSNIAWRKSAMEFRKISLSAQFHHTINKIGDLCMVDVTGMKPICQLCLLNVMGMKLLSHLVKLLSSPYNNLVKSNFY